MIALVVAVAANGVIGRENDLPWYLPADLKRFKELTTNHAVIMGRKTYQSIIARLGHALPKRTNIVITSKPTLLGPDVVGAGSLQDALEHAGDDDAFVIGGARVFAEALPIAHRLYLTEIKAEIEGDVFFPEFDRKAWHEVERTSHSKDEKNEYDYDFVTFERMS